MAHEVDGELKRKQPLKIGTFGISIEDIDKKDRGYAYFPIGDTDEKGEPSWIRYKIYAKKTLKAYQGLIVIEEGDQCISVIDALAGVKSESYLHDNHWEPDAEITVSTAGANGQQNLGNAVPAGKVRRIREITVRHAGTNATVITILAGINTKLTFDVTAQTTLVWSSQDGRKFIGGEQPAVRSSDVTGGNTFVSVSGVEE